jgi:hypothetical protein
MGMKRFVVTVIVGAALAAAPVTLIDGHLATGKVALANNGGGGGHSGGHGGGNAAGANAAASGGNSAGGNAAAGGGHVGGSGTGVASASSMGGGVSHAGEHRSHGSEGGSCVPPPGSLLGQGC